MSQYLDRRKELLLKKASELELEDIVIKKTFCLLEYIDDKHLLIGRTSQVIVCTCLYLAGLVVGQHKSQLCIADAFGSTTAALRAFYKKLLDDDDGKRIIALLNKYCEVKCVEEPKPEEPKPEEPKPIEEKKE